MLFSRKMQPHLAVSFAGAALSAATWADGSAGTARIEARSASETDDALLDRVSRGDRTAFRQLAERHAERSYALSFRIVRNAAAAEAAVRGSLAGLWANPAECRKSGLPLRIWLSRRIVRGCEPESDDAATATEAGAEAPPSDLEAAMDRLPWPERVALILSYHEHLTNDEIAQAMQLPCSKVEALLATARRTLLHGLPSSAG